MVALSSDLPQYVYRLTGGVRKESLKVEMPHSRLKVEMQNSGFMLLSFWSRNFILLGIGGFCELAGHC